MKDSDLTRILGIPSATLSDWKKPESKRKLLYEFLKSFSIEELEKRAEAIKLLKGIK